MPDLCIEVRDVRGDPALQHIPPSTKLLLCLRGEEITLELNGQAIMVHSIRNISITRSKFEKSMLRREGVLELFFRESKEYKAHVDKFRGDAKGLKKFFEELRNQIIRIEGKVLDKCEETIEKVNTIFVDIKGEIEKLEKIIGELELTIDTIQNLEERKKRVEEVVASYNNVVRRIKAINEELESHIKNLDMIEISRARAIRDRNLISEKFDVLNNLKKEMKELKKRLYNLVEKSFDMKKFEEETRRFIENIDSTLKDLSDRAKELVNRLPEEKNLSNLKALLSDLEAIRNDLDVIVERINKKKEELMVRSKSLVELFETELKARNIEERVEHLREYIEEKKRATGEAIRKYEKQETLQKEIISEIEDLEKIMSDLDKKLDQNKSAKIISDADYKRVKDLVEKSESFIKRVQRLKKNLYVIVDENLRKNLEEKVTKLEKIATKSREFIYSVKPEIERYEEILAKRGVELEKILEDLQRELQERRKKIKVRLNFKEFIKSSIGALPYCIIGSTYVLTRHLRPFAVINNWFLEERPDLKLYAIAIDNSTDLRNIRSNEELVDFQLEGGLNVSVYPGIDKVVYYFVPLSSMGLGGLLSEICRYIQVGMFSTVRQFIERTYRGATNRIQSILVGNGATGKSIILFTPLHLSDYLLRTKIYWWIGDRDNYIDRSELLWDVPIIIQLLSQSNISAYRRLIVDLIGAIPGDPIHQSYLLTMLFLMDLLLDNNIASAYQQVGGMSNLLQDSRDIEGYIRTHVYESNTDERPLISLTHIEILPSSLEKSIAMEADKELASADFAEEFLNILERILGNMINRYYLKKTDIRCVYISMVVPRRGSGLMSALRELRDRLITRYLIEPGMERFPGGLLLNVLEDSSPSFIVVRIYVKPEILMRRLLRWIDIRGREKDYKKYIRRVRESLEILYKTGKLRGDHFEAFSQALDKLLREVERLQGFIRERSEEKLEEREGELSEFAEE